MCLESFHTLAHDQAVWGLMEVLLGPDVLLQPSNIARMIFPSATEHTTPAHQDYVHIQGTPDVWTAWMPLGACPHVWRPERVTITSWDPPFLPGRGG